MNKKWFGLLSAILLMIGATAAMASGDPTYTEDWDGRGADSWNCAIEGENDPRYEFQDSGWIHWVFSTKGRSTDAVLTINGTDVYEPGNPLNANVWHFYTPYYELDGLAATIDLFGGDPGRGGGLVISDWCPGEFESLAVSKTANTAYTRTHDWKIGKAVKPSPLYLYTDGSYKGFGPSGNLVVEGEGSANVTWAVTVGYLGYKDSGYNVSGEITIYNDGQLPAVITAVEDVLAGNPIDVACGVAFPYTLPVGDTLTCSYSEDVAGQIEGFNEATVTTEKDVYAADPVALVWGDPDPDLYAVITIVDNSELFGEVTLGTLNAYDLANNPTTFTYSKQFAWGDYGQEGCGYHEYGNTATIAETGQSASATLKVYVQCLVFDGETAWGGDTAGSGSAWWYYYDTSVGGEQTIWAGQTTDIGTVIVSDVDADGNRVITMNLTGDWELKGDAEAVKIQGYNHGELPGSRPVAGQFTTYKGTALEVTVPDFLYYAIHLDVGQWVPDPDFGP